MCLVLSVSLYSQIRKLHPVMNFVSPDLPCRFTEPKEELQYLSIQLSLLLFFSFLFLKKIKYLNYLFSCLLSIQPYLHRKKCTYFLERKKLDFMFTPNHPVLIDKPTLNLLQQSACQWLIMQKFERDLQQHTGVET